MSYFLKLQVHHSVQIFVSDAQLLFHIVQPPQASGLETMMLFSDLEDHSMNIF